MSAVTVNSRTYSDDSNPVTGLGNGGHRTRLIPLFSDALTEISNQVLTASQSYRATSSSTVTIGAGLKNFAVTAGKGFAVGDLIMARSSTNAATFMAGAITAFNAATGALTLSVSAGDFGGSGAISDWVVLGPIGPRGLRGLAGLSYGWDASTTAGDPGAGLMRANNAALASATALYIDNLDAFGVDVSAQLTAWGASTSAVKGRLILRSQSDPTQQIIYDATAVAAATGYFSLTVVYRGGAASFAAGVAVDAGFSRTGDKGDVANPGQQFQFDTATAAADPGPGKIRFNNAALGGATAAYVDVVDVTGSDVSAWLATLGAGLSVQKGVLRLQSMTTLTKFAEFGVSAAANSTGYFTLNLTYLSPTPAPVFAAGEAVALLWSRAGDKGDTGSAGTITNAGDGSVTAPGFAFSSETGLGIRRKGAALAAVTGGGADLLELRPATLAEAQAGSNSLAVMTPQRVANAITALATVAVLPAQAGQAGKVLRTDGSAAAWAFQSGAGGAVVSGSVTLTASSAAAQAVTPTGLGQSVTLPSATTLGASAQIYQITNRSDKFQLGIRDAAGKLIEVIAPGGVCDLGLIDVSTPAGQWTANNSAPEGMLVTASAARLATLQSSPALSNISLGAVRLQVVGSDNSFVGGVYVQAFDSVTATLGAPVLVNASHVRASLIPLTATTALCVTASFGGDLSAVVITAAGSTLSLGSVATASGASLFPSAGQFQISELQALSPASVLGLFTWVNSSWYYAALAFSISGTTVTIGSIRRDLSLLNSPIFRNLNLPIAVLSPSTAAVFYTDGLTFSALVLTVSGVNITLGAVASVSAPQQMLFARAMPSGRWIVAYLNTSTQTFMRTVSVSGTVVTFGAEFNVGGIGYPNIAFVLDANRLFVASISSGAMSVCVVQDSGGALSSPAPPLSGSSGGPATYLGELLGAADNVIWAAKADNPSFGLTRVISRIEYDGASSLVIGRPLYPPRNGFLPAALFAKIGATLLFANLVCFNGRTLLSGVAGLPSGGPELITPLGGFSIAYWTKSPLNNAWIVTVAEVVQ